MDQQFFPVYLQPLYLTHIKTNTDTHTRMQFHRWFRKGSGWHFWGGGCGGLSTRDIDLFPSQSSTCSLLGADNSRNAKLEVQKTHSHNKQTNYRGKIAWKIHTEIWVPKSFWMEFTTLHIKSFGTRQVEIKETAGECKIYGEIGQRAATIANKIFIEREKQIKFSEGQTRKVYWIVVFFF